MKVSAKGGDFEQCPTGSHIARCIKLLDIGTQKGEWKGKPTHTHKIIIGWELPTALMTEGENAGKPFVVSKFYTFTISEKSNLRPDLVSWRGREFTTEEENEFDMKNILGKPCMLSVTANDKGKSIVSAVMAMPKGMEAPPQFNPTAYLSLERGEFDQKLFDSLSEKMQSMISDSPEWLELQEPDKVPPTQNHDAKMPAGFDNFDDDIPF